MVSRSIAILLVGAALGVGVQYGVEAQHKALGSVDADSTAAISNLPRVSSVTTTYTSGRGQTSEPVALAAGGDTAHIDQIRRAHAAIGNSPVRDQPPTF